MDASEIDVLVQRLVANPHDQEALAYAHNAGNADPKSYAVFLEKVGNATADPAYASHWLSEAANVWSITLGDALVALDIPYPGISFRRIDERRHLRPHIQIFVNGSVQRDLTAPLPEPVDVMIVAALSGG